MCQSCNAVSINGLYCHELGCSDSYKTEVRVCFFCGQEFTPEFKTQKECNQDCHNLIEQCNPINLPVYDNPPLQEGRYYQNDSKVVFYICELLLDTVSYRLMNPTTGSLTREFTKYRNYFSDNIIYKEYSK